MTAAQRVLVRTARDKEVRSQLKGKKQGAHSDPRLGGTWPEVMALPKARSVFFALNQENGAPYND